jgi:hexosaminidase
MKKKLSLLLVSAATITALGVNVDRIAIIPAPQKLERQEGVFALSADTRIVADGAAKETGEYLAEQLHKSIGSQLPVIPNRPESESEKLIGLVQDSNANTGPEGYELTVAPNSIVIRAVAPAGLFYGVQSLLQLLPPEAFSGSPDTNTAWKIPCVHIEDEPRFKWRGFMLDVSRHFFTKDEVKRVLDLMATQKLNTFHWHLVDDQGWRIEIKKYPRLTETGAWRAENGFGLDPKSTTAYGPDGRYGGFYTQDDIREVVAYAAARHITIVPEIEMPGHSSAALTAYPEFSCTDEPPGITTKGGIFTGVYCPSDKTFGFLQDVLTEVFELFPGKYIHIGGDEVRKDTWHNSPECQALMKREGLKNEEELQSWFIRRMEKFITAQGRTLIGWSEIREGGLAKSAVIMDWIGGGLEAAREGHDVVMTPTTDCYFDHYQSLDQADEPKAIGGFLPLQRVYAFEPIPAGLAPELQSHILGGQANLWTEYIPNLRQVEYMMFPRLAALSEVDWSPKSARDWNDFNERLLIRRHQWDGLDVNYRRDRSQVIGQWTPAQITATNAPGAALEWDVTPYVIEPGEYRIVFEWNQGNDGVDIASAQLLENSRSIALDQHKGFAGAKPNRAVYVLKVPAVTPGASYVLRASLTGSGGTDSQGTLTWLKKAATAAP